MSWPGLFSADKCDYFQLKEGVQALQQAVLKHLGLDL